MRRPRGPGGRFLTAEEIAAQKALQQTGGAVDADDDPLGDEAGVNHNDDDADHEMGEASQLDLFPDSSSLPVPGPSSKAQSHHHQQDMQSFSADLSMLDYGQMSQQSTSGVYPPQQQQQTSQPQQQPPNQQQNDQVTLHQPHSNPQMQTPTSQSPASPSDSVSSTSIVSHGMHHHAHPRHHPVFLPPIPGNIPTPSPATGVLRSPFNAMQMHHVPHPHAHARLHASRLNRQEGLYGPTSSERREDMP
jgi:nuclear transcription factor Y, alpha